MFSRTMIVMALAAVIPAAGYAQTQAPTSLGDLARQQRAQKAAAKQQNVITNDGAPAMASLPGMGIDSLSSAASNGSLPSDVKSAFDSLERWDTVIRKVDALDNATLEKNALQGASPNFPAHEAWENRFVAAKQNYVREQLGMIQNARQIMNSAYALQAAGVKEDDPRAQAFTGSLKQLFSDVIRSNAAFQAVIIEGRDLAKNSAATPPPASTQIQIVPAAQ